MAGSKYMNTAKKLQTACQKLFGVIVLINTKQWYSRDQKRAVTQYFVYQIVENKEKGKDVSIELFRTYSQIQLVLFMRDFWYELNGWEVPRDNKMWEEVKARYYEKNTSQTKSDKNID